MNLSHSTKKKNEYFNLWCATISEFEIFENFRPLSWLTLVYLSRQHATGLHILVTCLAMHMHQSQTLLECRCICLYTA